MGGACLSVSIVKLKSQIALTSFFDTMTVSESINVGKPSATGQPTQPFILSGSINE